MKISKYFLTENIFILPLILEEFLKKYILLECIVVYSFLKHMENTLLSFGFHC